MLHSIQIDNKTKDTFHPCQTMSAENIKTSGSYSKGTLSSVTHPSTTVSTRRQHSKSMLTDFGDLLSKIPYRLDPALFSDDEDEAGDDSKSEWNDHIVEEESFDDIDFHVESHGSHSKSAQEINKPIDRSSIRSEISSSERELQSNFQSADPIHKGHHNMPPTDRREKMWSGKKFQNSAESGIHGSKHPVKSAAASRPRQDNNTIEDFNWKKKVKVSSHQANSVIKSKRGTVAKIDELRNSNSSIDQEVSLKQSETLVPVHTPLGRSKSVESSQMPKEVIPKHTVKERINRTVKPHNNSEHSGNASCQEQEPTPHVPQEKSKVNRDDDDVVNPKRSRDDGEKQSESSKVDEITINKKKYMVLKTLGSGGSCKVYSVYDVGTKSVFAVKRVKLINADRTMLDGYKQEIKYLTKLQWSNRVIKMYDYEFSDKEIRLLLEKGDTDFSSYILNELKIKPLTPIMIKFYWSQMLEAVAEIHKLGIVHADLKPANFLLVEGHLKLIDFGISASVPTDMTSAIRETQVGTLNFISPEAITSFTTTAHTDSQREKRIVKIGVKADVWSLGCILYNLVYGHTPFSGVNFAIEKMRRIIDPAVKIRFAPLEDPLLLDVLKRCLKRNPKERASVDELMEHPYLTSEAKLEIQSTPVKSHVKFQDILTEIQSLTPGRMRVVSDVIQKMKSETKQ